MAKRDIIAIGGSTGSGAVLRHMVRGLPRDFPASIFISTHVPANSYGYLADTLATASALPVAEAIDGQPIEPGRIYVAASDRHLLLLNGTIRLGEGPRENMVRPSIDPLFRSAALAYGPRAVGVVLTGMLNDGAAGLHAIKAVGGTAIIQHPVDAEADQMPLAALEAVDADYVVSGDELADMLVRVAECDAGPARPPPEALALEVEIAAGKRLGSQALKGFADPSALTCPECQGVLSEVRGKGPLRYRCQIGHAFSAEALAAQIGEIDEALRVAMRVMEERLTLVQRMAEDARATGRTAIAELYEERAAEYRRYAETLREAAVQSLRMGGSMREQEL